MHDHPPKNKTDTLRTDIKDMYELEPADRYSFIRTLIENDELYSLPVYTKGDGIVCHYILDMKTAEGFGNTETNPPEALQADDDLFIRLKQCEILEIDTGKHRQPLFAGQSLRM